MDSPLGSGTNGELGKGQWLLPYNGSIASQIGVGMDITPQEVAETMAMVSQQNLDLRTITMGISLMGCADEDMGRMRTKVYDP